MKSVLVLLIACCLPVSAWAQLGTETSRKSLKDIRGFYVQVDIEGSVGLTSDEKLNASAINQRVKQQLRSAGLQVIEPTEVLDQPIEPYLYLHINMIEMEKGLVPFSTNLQFYQRATLERNKKKKNSMVVCTWDTGAVGLVSYDNLDLIAESAIASVDEFIDDFSQANGE